MVDIERVVTLDELMERVPEDLVRDAESRRMEDAEIESKSRESSMSKEPSKAKRIREFLDLHPESRNRDAVESLGQYGVTAADVANVKSHIKRTEGSSRSSRSSRASSTATKSRPETNNSTSMTSSGPTINWKELDAGVAFVKAAGSVQRAQHLLIIIAEIKGC